MGRAPTSNNCHTCRQRRVKCDKTRPVCNRCIKGRFECLGYENVLRMENHGVEGVGATSRLRKLETISSFPKAPIEHRGPAPNRPIPVSRAGEVALPSHARPAALDVVEQRLEAQDDDDAEEIIIPNRAHNIPHELDLGGFVDNMSFTYFFRNYGWINMHSIMLQDDSMQHHLEDGGMAQDSLRALSYGLLGRDRNIQSLRHSARGLYGKALHTLRAKLDGASKDQLVRMLKPIAVMGAYSISVENDLRFTHHQGMARILEHCGPEYFQSPETLPIFESCRWTLVSNAMVRREPTFLTKPEWKTIPWARSATPKSQTMRLLDILSEVPALLGGIWMVLVERIRRRDDPFAPLDELRIPNNLGRIHELEIELASWRTDWLALHPAAGPKLLSWSLQRTGNDTYRPGYTGHEGPDAFPVVLSAAMADNSQAMASLSAPSTGLQTQQDASASIPQLMQDTALYLTTVVWLARLRKYNMTADLSNDSVNYFETPFQTHCACCTALADQNNPNGAPFEDCETNPPSGPAPVRFVQGHPATTHPASAWNATTHRIGTAPTRISDATTGALDTYSSSSTCTELGSPGPHPAALRIPGDIRFAGQLRILGYLVDRLPATRSAVVSTLAAIGLGHCGHDVRPAEGIPEVADTVNRALMSTGVDGTDDLLLREWRPKGVLGESAGEGEGGEASGTQNA